MKIAIASDDQLSIAQHFGRARGFVIAEIEEGTVRNKAYRENTFSAHARGAEHVHGQHGHSHADILKALADCELVLARGMGRRIYDDLRSGNIQSMITDKVSVEDALEAYLAGELVDNPEKGCHH